MSASTGSPTAREPEGPVDLHPEPAPPRPAALLTIDVEDWYHVNYQSWTPSDPAPDTRRVDVNTSRIVELCRRRGLRATFFILGVVARDFPDLVRAIARDGHEIACHGMDHDLVYELGEARFRAAIEEARARLQDLSGQAVLGFRAPSWSITRRSLWALDAIGEAGFRYDASLFPLENYLYGLGETPRAPAWIRTPGGARLFEIPASALRVGPLCVPHGGGFYLRMMPLWLERLAMRRHQQRGEPSILYIHPRELDDVEIAMPLRGVERFIQGARVKAGSAKLRWLLENVAWRSIADVYAAEIHG